MRVDRLISCFLLAVVLARGVAEAQQREVNSVGGALTSHGVDPIPGAPFELGPNVSVDFEVRGAPNSPYALFFGSLAQSSLFIPGLAGQWFDLELGTAVLLGDALAGNGALPPFLFFTGPGGVSSWSIPLSPVAVGVKFAFQALVQDLTLPPFNANLTAAVEFEVSNTVRLTGQSFANYTFPSGPYPIYGGLYGSIDVSTSGWIRFGGGSTTVDAFQNLGKFLAGTAGVGAVATPAPVIAVFWNTMDFPGSASEVVITETSPGITRIEWRNAIDLGNPIFPGQNIGTIACEIDITQGATIVVLDYSAMNFPPNPVGMPFNAGPICGLSDGGLVPSVMLEHDLVFSGSVNGFPATAPVTVYQEFGILSGFPEDVDLSGRVLTFRSLGFGNFELF